MLKPLEEFLAHLDAQTDPVETAYRADRQAVAKKTGATYVEPLPGSESEPWAKATIQKLIFIRANLSNIARSARALGKFVVYNREYCPQGLVRQYIER